MTEEDRKNMELDMNKVFDTLIADESIGGN